LPPKALEIRAFGRVWIAPSCLGEKSMKFDLDAVREGALLFGDALHKTAKDLVRQGRAFVNEVRYDVESIRQRDPAATGSAEILLLYSGLHARTAHRISHKLYERGHTFSARAVSQLARLVTGIEIHPGATIGKGLVIDHGAGVVIGETAEIGDNCTIYQGVTLGGTGKDVGKRHPTLGDNVMVGAGAKILGPLEIGDNVKIAAGAVVLENIPDDSTAVGIPARVVRVKGVRIANDLDQIHIPDPVEQKLTAINTELRRLRKRVAELEPQEGKKKPRSAAKEKKTPRGDEAKGE